MGSPGRDLERVDGSSLVETGQVGNARSSGSGRSAELSELAGCLDDLGMFFERHVCFEGPDPAWADAARDATVLWTALTYCPHVFGVSPRLAILSPTMGSGKSTLLQLVAMSALDSVLWVNPSDASVFRARQNEMLTMLFDEVDAVFGTVGGRRSDLRSMLNEGYRQGASVPRVGPDLRVEEFPVFGPAGFAGVGAYLPATVASRSIRIDIWRSPPGYSLIRLDVPWHRREAEWDADRIRKRLIACVYHQAEEIAATPVIMPTGIIHRNAELWRPLLAIAQHAGGDWRTRARHAARTLTGRDDDPALFVLSAVRDAFDAEGQDRVATATLVRALDARDDNPWHATRGTFDAKDLARTLAPFDIRSRNQRYPNGGQSKGYSRVDFETAWKSYLSA